MTRWALTGALVVLWEVGGRLTIDDARTALLVPLPSAVVATAWALTRDGSLVADIARSLYRVLAGGAAAVLVGVPIGALIATSPRIGAALDAPMRVLRPVPPVAWVPLTLLWFGVTELQQLAILFFAAVFVVIAGTSRAVAGVPARLLTAARNLGAGEATVALRVAVPAGLPGVAAAVREGVGTAWFVLVAAEFLSASEGLGVLILEGRDLLEPARAFVGMAALGACAALTDAALGAAFTRGTRWA